MFTTKKNLIFVVVLLVAALLMGCSATPAGTTPATGGITVLGYGEAQGQPNQAQVQVGVESFAPTAVEASTQNEETIQAIITALKALSIAEQDIQTANYNLWVEQIYGEQGPQGIAGYHVSNQVNVTIKDIDQVGDVLAAATTAGANSIYGVYFSVADTSALEAEARAAAVADARARAQSLAELSGVALGEVIEITEVIGSYPVPAVRSMASEGAGGGVAPAPSINPGTLSYSTQIQVTFAIK